MLSGQFLSCADWWVYANLQGQLSANCPFLQNLCCAGWQLGASLEGIKKRLWKLSPGISLDAMLLRMLDSKCWPETHQAQQIAGVLKPGIELW